MLLSIVVPTHGRWSLLAEAIASIRAQGVRQSDIEVIVVADGVAVPICCVPDGIPPARVVDNRGRGRSAARNTGLAVALGQWVMFLDDDDLLLAGALEALLTVAHAAGPRVVCIYGSFLTFHSVPPLVSPRSCVRRRRDESLFLSTLGGDERLYAGAFVSRRSAAMACGAFREGLDWAEVQDFALRLSLQGHFVSVATEVLAHRRHGNQSTLPPLDERLAIEEPFRREAAADAVSRNLYDAKVVGRRIVAWRHKANAFDSAGKGRIWDAVLSTARMIMADPRLVIEQAEWLSIMRITYSALVGSRRRSDVTGAQSSLE